MECGKFSRRLAWSQTVSAEHICAKVKKISEDMWMCSFAALEDVASDIQGGCSSATMPSHLRWVAELERYVWHRASEHQKGAALGKKITDLGKQLQEAINQSEAQIRRHHNATGPVNVRQLKTDLGEARRCIRGAVPWFLVFAEDADFCGRPCSSSFGQIHHEIAEKLGAASESTCFPFLRKLTRIGVSAKDACDCSAFRAIESENRSETARRFLSGEAIAKQHQVEVRKTSSLKYLLSECSRQSESSECNPAEMHIGFAFSDIVHDIFREQQGKLRFALDRDLFDDAQAIFSDVSQWSALHQVVQPELKVADLEQWMKEGLVVRKRIGFHPKKTHPRIHRRVIVIIFD